jgi:hypothetical protein
MEVEGQPKQKERFYLQNNQNKKGQMCAQVIEHLPSEYEALSSNLTAAKKDN